MLHNAIVDEQTAEQQHRVSFGKRKKWLGASEREMSKR